MLIFNIAMGILYWWWVQPRTPEELFRVRCMSCHELRAQRLCEFTTELRPAIVQVMRDQYGADQLISGKEAMQIKKYLKEDFQCQ